MDTLAFLVVYVLSAAFLFHVWARSDLTKVPREWVMRVSPGWVKYMMQCPLCLAFHAGWLGTVGYWLATGVVLFAPVILFAAPMAVLMVDLALRALIRANEPPLLEVSCGSQESVLNLFSSWANDKKERERLINDAVTAQLVRTTLAGPSTILSSGLPRAVLTPEGEVRTGWDSSILPGQFHTPPPPLWKGPIPEGWEVTDSGTLYGLSFSCPGLHGRKVRTSYFQGKTGVIVNGFRNGDDCSDAWGELMYTLRWEPNQIWFDQPLIGESSVPVKSCVFLDDGEPFNPVAHEQTK